MTTEVPLTLTHVFASGDLQYSKSELWLSMDNFRYKYADAKERCEIRRRRIARLDPARLPK
jgi:hypothetical protein